MRNFVIFSQSLLMLTASINGQTIGSVFTKEMPMGSDVILIQDLTTIVGNENTFNKFSSTSEEFKTNVSATGVKDPSITNYVACSYKAAYKCFTMFSFDDTNGCILYTYEISSNEVAQVLTCGSSAVIHLYVNYNPDDYNCVEDPIATGRPATTTVDPTTTTDDATTTSEDQTTTTTNQTTTTDDATTTTEDQTTTTEDQTTTTEDQTTTIEDQTTTTDLTTTTTPEDQTTTTEDQTTTTEDQTTTTEDQTTTTEDQTTTTNDPTTTTEDQTTTTEDQTTTTEDATTSPVHTSISSQDTITTDDATKIPAERITTEDPIKANTCTCGSENNRKKIVGGTETAVNQYPYIVRMLVTIVGNSRIYSCGASILSETVVLTAAHCLKINGKLALANNVQLQFGAHDTKNPPSTLVTLTAKELILHEEYNNKNHDNDIAVVILQERLNFTREISPVCLPYNLDMTTLPGKIATVMGWGTFYAGSRAPNALRHVELGIIVNENCETQFPGLNGRITENMFCAYSMRKDTCHGDSGGPLVYKQDGRDFEIGVVSWGIGCGGANAGVYSKVVNYLTWIEEKTKQSFCKP